jgi:sugar/nucleoside kinase (ribokinase family)
VSRYLTVGNLLVEDVVLPDGDVVRDRLGGDALYAAIGARAFADDVELVVRLGRGFPSELIAALDEAGYAAGLVPSDHEAVRLRVEWGVESNTRFTFQEGSGTYVEATPTPDEIPPALAERLEAVHIAPVPFEQMEALVAWARPRARIVTVDPHYQHVAGMESEWRRILPQVDAFLPSRDEAATLLGGWPGAEEAVGALAELGAPVVCVKLGAEGSIGCRADEVVRVRAATADPVDPTGCGDAFCGGFLVGLAETDDLRTALAHGSVAAGFVADDHGAAHALTIDREETRRRLEALRP